MIYHFHTKEIPSTQNYLKEHLETLLCASSQILISTDSQTQGIGRRSNSWHHGRNALAFSFTLPYFDKMSMVSQETAVLLVKFLKYTGGYEIGLKWPNDLINKRSEKCGGIVVHLQNKTLIVGVGINWGRGEFAGKYRYAPGVVDKFYVFKNEDYEKIPFDFYTYLLAHRLSVQETREEWMRYCCHLNEVVQIYEDSGVEQGIFLGIGRLGEAVLRKGDHVKTFFTGSLSLGR